MAVFICPSCQHSQTVDDKHVGKAAACPKCKASSTVAQADNEPLSPAGPDDSRPTVLRMDGGEMGIDNELVNKESGLRREWIFLNDPALPVSFVVVCLPLRHEL